MKTIKFNSKQILLASLFGLFILAGTVNAKGTETGFVSSYENITEEQLEVEDWMVNENYWKPAEASLLFTAEAEAGLELESWMTSENNWKLQSLVIVENTSEEELTIEDWMVQEKYWKL